MDKQQKLISAASLKDADKVQISALFQAAVYQQVSTELNRIEQKLQNQEFITKLQELRALNEQLFNSATRPTFAQISEFGSDLLIIYDESGLPENEQEYFSLWH